MAGNGNSSVIQRSYVFLTLVIFVCIGLLEWFYGSLTLSRLWAWYWSLGLLFLATALVGVGICGRWDGILIDERYRISLSRFQMVLWTLLILSALSTAQVTDLSPHKPQDTSPAPSSGTSRPVSTGISIVDVQIPPELFALMGISVTSLVASPLVLAPKKEKNPDPQAAAIAVATLGARGERDPMPIGKLMGRTDPSQSRWSDLFQGEEVGNAGTVDLSRLQNLYFTLLLAVIYIAALYDMFTANGRILTLPPLTSGMITLLGISHAGYLVAKSTDKGQAAPSSPPHPPMPGVAPLAPAAGGALPPPTVPAPLPTLQVRWVYPERMPGSSDVVLTVFGEELGLPTYAYTGTVTYPDATTETLSILESRPGLLRFLLTPAVQNNLQQNGARATITIGNGVATTAPISIPSPS